MAKKATTPMPPKRVQAPKVRTPDRHRPGADERRRRLFLYGFGAAGFIGLLVVLLIVLVSGGNGGTSSSAITKTMAAAGYSYREYNVPKPPKGETHVASLTAKPKWETSPPSGGQHYFQPAAFNFYDEAVTPVQAVHNLEHGAMVIWYGPDISAETKTSLREFYNESPDGMLITPFAGFGAGKGDNIALTAWTGDPEKYQHGTYYGEGHFAEGKGFDEKAFKAFRNAFRAKGPERFPLSAMAPNN